MRSLLILGGSVAGLGAAAVIAGVAVAGQSAATDDTQDFVTNSEASSRACFRVNQGYNFAPADTGEFDGVNLNVRGDEVYQLSFINPCPFLKQATGIQIRTTNGSSRLCNGSDAEVTLAMEVGGAMTCTVNGVRKLSAQEIAALPSGERP